MPPSCGILYSKMPKISVYAPVLKLKAIDAYCAARGTSRSVLLVNAAMSAINAGRIPCEFQGCRGIAIGRYKLTIYDVATGETDRVLNLCQAHHAKAKLEGSVHEVE